VPSVLFVCTANQFRSPLAAACLKDFIAQHITAEAWRVESAGTWAKAGLHASMAAIQNANRLGLHILDDHITRQVDRQILEQFDLILVMERNHLEAIANEFPNIESRLVLLAQVVDDISYDIPDPADQVTDPNAVASELAALIDRGGKKILQSARKHHRERLVLDKGH